MTKNGRVNDGYNRVQVIEDKNLVYCGRSEYWGGPSKFANPFRIKADSPRGSSIEKYRKHLWNQIETGIVTREELVALEDKTLLCHCKPYPCHTDIIINAIKWAMSQEEN